MSKLKVAIQKSGRLSENSMQLLKECGIKFSNGSRILKASSTNFPIEILYLRDDDIPQYVEQGIADIGILGENEVWEKNKVISVVRKLGFAACKLSLAIPKEEDYSGIQFFEGKRIATSYPKILNTYFKENGITASIEEIGGSVEIAPSIGLANGIFDIVSSGSTLLMNGLKEVEVVSKSEAVLIQNPNLPVDKLAVMDRLLFRLEAVLNAKSNKYILLNAPNNSIDKIIEILPGMRSPTVLPLAQSQWSSLHSVIQEDEFWDNIDELKALGAEGILIVPIEKMIV